MVKELRHSASKITTYKGCSFAFFLKYIKHEIVAESVRLSFGKVVHSMLDQFYEKNFKSEESFAKSFKFHWFRYCSGDGLSKKLREHFPTKEYSMNNGRQLILSQAINFFTPNPSKTEEEIKEKTKGIFFGYMKIGERIMKEFYETWINRPDPVIREEPFELYIQGLPNRQGIRKKHHVMAIFDRVDEKDGHVVLSDYKTDSGDPLAKSFSIHRNPQFSLYSLALRQLIAEKRISFPCRAKEESAIFYYHLKTGKLLETHRSTIDHEYVRALLDDVADGIQNSRFTPFYGFHCELCDHRVSCEKWSIAHGGPRITLEEKIKTANTINWDDDFNTFLKRRESRLLMPEHSTAEGLYLPNENNQAEFKFTYAKNQSEEPTRDIEYKQKKLNLKKPKPQEDNTIL